MEISFVILFIRLFNRAVIYRYFLFSLITYTVVFKKYLKSKIEYLINGTLKVVMEFDY